MNYSVNLSSGQTVEVVIGEAAQINVEQALNYIESGRVEITKYVNEWAKPEITNYTNEYAKPIVAEVANQTTKPLIDDYLNTTTKPQIDEYVADNVKPYADSAQDSAAKAKISKDNAKTSETNAKASELAAASSAGVASAAAVTATEAKDYTAKVLTDENLKTVGQDLQSADSNIKTVATNILNVNTVAKNIDNVNLLAPHTEAMEALAPDIMDVVTVAGITEQTKNVSENMTAVVDVSNNKTNINNVSANITAVNNVSENMADVKNAVQSANDAKLWAVGTKTEKPEGSSKYWAEQAKNAVQTPDATETVKGIVRLATSEEVTAGTNDSAAITPLKLKQKLDTKQDKSTAVNYDNISNCITEIPQDIKLELNNGTLTLKAGSKVYVPNNFESDGTTKKFDIKIIENDITVASPYTNEPIFIYYHNNGIEQAANNAQCSGTSNTVNYGYWYDTTNNFIKRMNVGEVAYSDVSFPLAIINASNGSWVSIDQVFNGFGYIGSTVFALPGVKGLIPNGRNADGSLKSIDSITTKVNLLTFSTDTDGTTEIVTANDWIGESIGHYSYNSESNFVLFDSDKITGYMINSCKVSKGRITSFTPKTVFHALDYNDFSDLKNTVDTNDSNVVHKTGDETISGLKTFDNFLLIKKSLNDFSVAPQNPIYTEIRNVDVNGYEIGQFRVWKDKDGANVIDLLGRYQHGTANVYGATLGVKTYADGVSYGYCVQNRPWLPGALVTLTSQHYSSNGYVKYSNGIIIQWGKGAATNSYTSVQTITLPIAFSNTNYSITFGTLLTEANKKCEKMFHIQNKTTTNFQAYCSYTGGTNHTTVSPTWIAIGY